MARAGCCSIMAAVVIPHGDDEKLETQIILWLRVGGLSIFVFRKGLRHWYDGNSCNVTI